jgi:hypothetical protein
VHLCFADLGKMLFHQVHIHQLLHDHQKDFIRVTNDGNAGDAWQKEALTQFVFSYALGDLADDLDFILNAKAQGISTFNNLRNITWIVNVILFQNGRSAILLNLWRLWWMTH